MIEGVGQSPTRFGSGRICAVSEVETIAPAPLRREFRRRLSTDGFSPNVRCPTAPNQPHSASSIALLRMAQEDDDDMVAVRRVLMRVAAICRRAAGRSHSNRFSESLRHYWRASLSGADPALSRAKDSLENTPLTVSETSTCDK